MAAENTENLVSLSLEQPVWNQVFSVAPLVLIGTLGRGGVAGFAPGHAS